MRKILLFWALFSLVIGGYSQAGFINFYNSSDLFRIKIDTSNPYNCWQIGRPNKTVFNSSYSPPNAIVTDTIHPYPVNNNSVFYLGFSLPDYNPWYYEETDLSFYFKLETDSLTDWGKIEFSIDTGKTYYNILQVSQFTVTDSAGNIIASNGVGNPVVFTGTYHGWCYFSTKQIELPYPDTIIYRFTFHSDSVQTNRDGWMIDNITYLSFWEGIQESGSGFKIYPNPAKDFIKIRNSESRNPYSLCFLDDMGIVRKKVENLQGDREVYVGDLAEGVYFVVVESGGVRTVVKVVRM